jgi:hypothetical protein
MTHKSRGEAVEVDSYLCMPKDRDGIDVIIRERWVEGAEGATCDSWGGGRSDGCVCAYRV